MIGTFVNVIAVLVGSSLGLLLNKSLPERYIKIFFQVMGIFTIFLGISMALKSTHILHMVMALIAGSLVGEALNLQSGMERFGEWLKQKIKFKSDKFTDGLLTAFLLYCVGSMTIIGAFEEGMGGSPKLLLIKSLMDGVSSIALASGLGIGVMFSVVPLIIFQGGLTLLAMLFGDFFPGIMITELTAVGGILLIGLGIDILEIKKIKVMNMLPALIMILLILWLIPEIGIWQPDIKFSKSLS
jgi:uncharacterized membrane protein YqgA involved in biofilm formation